MLSLFLTVSVNQAAEYGVQAIWGYAGCEVLALNIRKPLHGRPPPMPLARRPEPHWGGAGRRAVIHDDHGLAVRVIVDFLGPVQPFLGLQFPPFLGRDTGDDRIRYFYILDHTLIEDPHSAGCNDPHGRFFTVGDHSFADHEHIQSQLQGVGHLVGHRNASPRERQHPRFHTIAPYRISAACRAGADKEDGTDADLRFTDTRYTEIAL